MGGKVVFLLQHSKVQNVLPPSEAETQNCWSVQEKQFQENPGLHQKSLDIWRHGFNPCSSFKHSQDTRPTHRTERESSCIHVIIYQYQWELGDIYLVSSDFQEAHRRPQIQLSEVNELFNWYWSLYYSYIESFQKFQETSIKMCTFPLEAEVNHIFKRVQEKSYLVLSLIFLREKKNQPPKKPKP